MANFNFTLKRGTSGEDTLFPQTTWTQVLNKPTTFTPTAHTHTLVDLTDTVISSPVNGQVLKYDGTFWINSAADGGGDVTGPALSTNNNIVTFNGTTGKLIKDSGTLISSLATSTHTHGNISTSGTISSTATIANGDRIIIGDTGTITQSSITFGTATDTALLNNGTWGSPWTTSLENLTAFRTTDLSLTSLTNVLTIPVTQTGTYRVFMSGAYFSTSTTIGVQVSFTYSGTLSTVPDSVFNITVSLNSAASSGDFHNAVPMNTAVTSTSVNATNTDIGMSAIGLFRATGTGDFSLRLAPETGTTSVGCAEGTFLSIERIGA